jgi:hypothetical protein
MAKLWVKGQNLGQVFYFGFIRSLMPCSTCIATKCPILKLKTRLQLAFALSGLLT